MNAKTIILASALAAACMAPARAQSTAATIVDNDIVLPSSLDTDVRDLQENWYLQRYAVIDSAARRARQADLTDELCIERLQRLPTVIEMPYNSVVRTYIDLYAGKRANLVEKCLGMSLYYMPIFEDALERYQLPPELKYLTIVESAMDPTAVSRAGAAGLWQFMPSTATGEGLEVNGLVDERRDPIASSDAAARYLKKLYDMYGDWHLALAAYNCGPGTVNKAIKKSHDQKDYWAIYYNLPKETRGYVPAFIAANYIMTYYGEHGISHVLARKPLVTDTVHVCRRVHFQQISDVLGIPIDEIRILNPQYRADVIPGNIRPYTLTLPSLQAYCYAANEDSIVRYRHDDFHPRETVEPVSLEELETIAQEQQVMTDEGGQYVEDLTVKYHKVKKGETINSIANKYGVTVESIKRANNLSTSRVKTGKTLKINIYTKRYLTDEEKQDGQAAAPADSAAAQQAPVVEPIEAPANEQPADSTAVDASAATPAPAVETKPEPAKPKPKAEAKPKTYKVQKGDTLSKIANKHGVTVDQIKKENGLKSDRINVGQTLKIPAKKGKK